MQQAAHGRIYERLDCQSLIKPKLLQFGFMVMIRRNVFGNNRKYDLTDRWRRPPTWACLKRSTVVQLSFVPAAF